MSISLRNIIEKVSKFEKVVVFGAGEMVLESTGKETLPLSNVKYITYRYSVDKDCNIKLYKVYDEVK